MTSCTTARDYFYIRSNRLLAYCLIDLVLGKLCISHISLISLLLLHEVKFEVFLERRKTHSM